MYQKVSANRCIAAWGWETLQGVSECGDDGFSEQNCEGREQKGAGRVQGNPLRDPLRQQNNSGGDQMASWEILKIEVSMEKNRKQ